MSKGKYKVDPEVIYEGLLLDLSNQLAALMKYKQTTAKQLAEKMCVDIKFIKRILNAEENLDLETIAKLLAALEVDDPILLVM